MSYIADVIFDNGLSYLNSNGSRLDVCSQEPANYTEATSTYTLGNKTSLTAGAPQDGATDGRRSVIPAITDGSVTGTATATHWAYSKTTSSAALLSSGPLTSSQSVTSGNTFTRRYLCRHS